MDKYIEIQKIFSDFYFKKIVPYIKLNDIRRDKYSCLWGIFILSLIMVIAFNGFQYVTPLMRHEYAWEYSVPGYVYVAVFSLVFIGCPLIVMLCGYLCGFIIMYMLKANKVVDKKLKQRFFPDLFKQLNFIEWIDEKPVQDDEIDDDNERYSLFGVYKSKYRTEVISILQDNKLVDVHTSFFEVDDVFKGKLNDSEFSIYEVSNKHNIVHILVSVICFNILAPIILLFLLFTFLPKGFFTYLFKKPLGNIILLIYIIVYNIWNIRVKNVTDMKLNFLDNRFRGVVAVFNLNKRIEGCTLIFENHYDNKLVKEILAKGYEKVSFEDEEFNKKYSVYTTNQIEARYALTTAMMERLKNLEHHFKSKYIRASFKEDKLVIAIQSDKDLFRLASAWKETEPKDYQTMFMEIISILKITDALNLQSDTGL